MAETEEIARAAAKAVKITYKNIQKPILTIKDALEKDPARIVSEFPPMFGMATEAVRMGDLKGNFISIFEINANQ